MTNYCARELGQNDRLRVLLPEAERDYGDMYAIYNSSGMFLMGITDEYGTCHWSEPSIKPSVIEDLVLNEQNVCKPI